MRAAAVLLIGAAVLLPAAPAHAFTCPDPPARAADQPARPLTDQLYDPARLAAFATGAGVRVAVLDSGVDATNPQLAGQVAAGRDFLHEHPDGRQDCVGHGTAVASVIAAAPRSGAGLRGLAPDATIVPVRVSERTDDSEQSDSDFAAAIDFAAADADVLNLSLVTTRDDPRVRAAVARALAAGVIVVAAAGNKGGPGEANPVPYPAAYPGVIGVAALDPTGVRGGFSQRGDYVDLAAPGVAVTLAVPGGGQTTGQGTSFATPFVAATAALLRERFPALSPAQVLRRLQATADPAPGGARSDSYGAGVLNPLRALTETLTPQTAAASSPPAVYPGDPGLAARTERRTHARDLSLLLAATVAAVLLLTAITTTALRHARETTRP